MSSATNQCSGTVFLLGCKPYRLCAFSFAHGKCITLRHARAGFFVPTMFIWRRSGMLCQDMWSWTCSNPEPAICARCIVYPACASCARLLVVVEASYIASWRFWSCSWSAILCNCNRSGNRGISSKKNRNIASSDGFSTAQDFTISSHQCTTLSR